MFGFSLTKLIFTVAVIAAVWYGFKWVGRMKKVREREAKERLHRQAGKETSGGAPEDTQGDASGDTEEMMECPACGAFVAAQAPKSCGKAECPYPG